MRKPISSICLAATLCLAMPATAADPREEATRLYTEARALHEQGAYDKAEPVYQRSWDLVQSFDTAGNLGECELSVKQFREAAEHLTYAKAHLPSGATPEQRAQLDDFLAKAQRQVFTLTIEVDEPGAQVSVDGRALGVSPLSAPVFLDSGSRTVNVEKAGFVSIHERVDAKPGKMQRLTLKLVPDGSAVGDGTTSSASKVPAWIGGGIALVGVGLGIALAVAAGGVDSDAAVVEREISDAQATCGDSPTAGYAQRCQDYDDLRSEHSTLRTASGISFAVGGVAAAATLTYLLLSSGGAPAKQGNSLRAVPSIGPRGSGLSLVGAF